jgi:hypothetical protein
MSLVKHTEYDTEKISINKNKLIKLKNRSMFVPISYNNETFYIQTPVLRIPFELKDYQGKYKLNLSIDQSNDTFTDFLTKIDETIIDIVSKDNDLLEYLNLASTSYEIIDVAKRIKNSGLYCNSFKTDYEYDPLFKAKFKTNRLDSHLSVTYENVSGGTTVPLTYNNIKDMLPQNLWVKCIIKVKHVWFVNKKFGITYEVIKIKEADIPMDDQETNDENINFI